MTHLFYSLRASLIVLPLLVAAGCLEAQPRSHVDVTVKQSLAVTQEQMRLRMRSEVQPMCGRIEDTADAIIESTKDPDVRMAGLMWKIEAVPALREALFQPDPFTAALDTLVLCDQMIDYFEKGPGKQALGPASAQALATCRSMEEQFNQVLNSATISGQMPKAREFAKQWAAENPIRRSISDRPTVLARVFERGADSGISAGEAIAETTTTVDDLNRKIGVYSDQLFRQGRWEAERFKAELIAELRADQAIPLAERAVKAAENAVATIDRLTPTLERSLETAQNVPAMVASERQIMLKSVQSERIATLQQIAQERGTALTEVAAIMARQRTQLAADADQIAIKRVDYAAHKVEQIVAVTIAVAAFLVLIGMLLARWLFVSRPA
jgi:hypothetical protein